MENYQLLLEKYIESLDGRKKLLLHSCCAPCSSYVLTYLRQYFDITLFYYNPNIHPIAEYQKRAEEQKRLCDILDIPYLEGEYDTERFFKAALGLENEREGGGRCEKCFELRLDVTAKTAKQLGFELIATTLTVSPHKNAPLINAVGEACAKAQGVLWLPSDFKKRNGYKISIELSKEYDLYRQNYCGCTFSV